MSEREAWSHTTVLLHEAIDALVTVTSGIYVDGTFGRGGHSRLLLSRLSPQGRVIAFDRDPEAVAAAMQGATRVTDPRFSIHPANFAQMRELLAAQGITRVQGVLLDLGVSSPQIDDAARGFSFRFDAPLDMRMDPTRGESAADFLARADERTLTQVIRDHGEERFAFQIAKAIVARRGDAGEQALRTTAELAALVAGVVRRRQGRAQVGKDPATRTFQALRIHVNQELEELALVLGKSVARLAQGGRLVVISFHSLEDRMVKQFIAREAGRDAPRDCVTGVVRHVVAPRLRAIARVLPVASGAARRGRRARPENPRERSAVMRVAERL